MAASRAIQHLFSIHFTVEAHEWAGRQLCHLVKGLIEGEDPLLAHINGENTGKCARTARMSAVEPAVAAEHDERVGDEALEVLVRHGGHDDALTSGLARIMYGMNN